jgi:carbonic anhydrase
VSGVEVNASALLPTETGYYTFAGSLTTPPCSEAVTWFVLKNPTQLSAGDVEAFAKIFPHNARPIQPTNGRTIAETQ